jgi:hypothetical protein
LPEPFPKREPAAWETDAPGPVITMPREQGTVAVWPLGQDRFRVEAPDATHQLIGFEAARVVARGLAEQLGEAVDVG